MSSPSFFQSFKLFFSKKAECSTKENVEVTKPTFYGDINDENDSIEKLDGADSEIIITDPVPESKSPDNIVEKLKELKRQILDLTTKIVEAERPENQNITDVETMILTIHEGFKNLHSDLENEVNLKYLPDYLKACQLDQCLLKIKNILGKVVAKRDSQLYEIIKLQQMLESDAADMEVMMSTVKRELDLRSEAVDFTESCDTQNKDPKVNFNQQPNVTPSEHLSDTRNAYVSEDARFRFNVSNF